MAIPEYTEYPEFNELSEETQGAGSLGGGLAEYSGLSSGGGESEPAAEDGSSSETGSGGSAFLKKQKKKLLSQVMAFTTTAAIAVTAVTVFPVGAKTRVQEVSQSSALVSTRFLALGDRENREVTYRLYEETTRELLEQGKASLDTKNLEFDSLEAGKTYRLQILYEDKVIRSQVFNTLMEVGAQPSEEPPVPETKPAQTKAPTEPEIEVPTEPETEAPTETEPETEAPTEPETEAPTEAYTEPPAPQETEAPTEPPTLPETEAPTEPETPAASLWSDGNGQITDEIHTTQIQEGNLDYSVIAETAADAGPSSLPRPEYMKCSYGSAAYPFYPILEQISWSMPERAGDAKLYLEWSVTTENGGTGTEVHRSEITEGSLSLSNVAANVSTPICSTPGVVAFTPCYIYKGCLVRLNRQIIPLPYLSPWIDFASEGEKSGLKGMDTLEHYGLTMRYDGIRYEKLLADSWQDASLDFASGHFDSDTDYRVTYDNVVVENPRYGAEIAVSDVSVTEHHEGN